MAEHPFGHEPSAIANARILKLGGIILAVLLVVVTALHFILGAVVMPQHNLVVARKGMIPPPPRLQAHPGPDLAALRAQKKTALSTYAWVDASHAFARIPIQRAMDLYTRQHSAGARRTAPVARGATDAPAGKQQP